MKRILAIIIAIITLSSCISGEFIKLQGNHFAEVEAKKLLYVPDSYEAIETIVDSAILSAYNDPTILANASEIVEINNNTLFHNKQSREKIAKYTDNIKSRLAELKEGEFIGWEIRHRFRAKDNDGRADILDMLFISDKGFTKNLFTASLNREELGSYSEIVDCIDRIIDESKFESSVEEVINDLNDAVNEIINEAKEIDINQVINNVEETTKELVKNVEKTTNKVVEEVKKIDKSKIEKSTKSVTEASKDIVDAVIYETTKIIETATNDITPTPATLTTPTPSKKVVSQTSYSNDYFEYETNTNTIDSNTLLELNGL